MYTCEATIPLPGALPTCPQMRRPGATSVPSLDPVRVSRVHQHDARDDGRIEQFIVQLGVMAGHSGCREQSIQAVAAKRGDFVEGKASVSLCRPDRENPSSG